MEITTLVWAGMAAVALRPLADPVLGDRILWPLLEWLGRPAGAGRRPGMSGLDPTNPKEEFGRAKPPVSSIPGIALLAEAEVFRHGAAKYYPNSWRHEAIRYSTYASAIMRHILAPQRGGGAGSGLGASASGAHPGVHGDPDGRAGVGHDARRPSRSRGSALSGRRIACGGGRRRPGPGRGGEVLALCGGPCACVPGGEEMTDTDVFLLVYLVGFLALSSVLILKGILK